MSYNINSKEKIREFIPPHSIEAEQQVIGAILKDPDAINKVIEVLTDPAVFYERKHKKIFNVILDLYEKSEPCDLITLSEKLKDFNELEKVGGRVYLAQLTEYAVSTANVAYHAKIVLQKALLNELIKTSNNINQSCYGEVDNVDELIDNAEKQIFGIAESRIRKGFQPMKDLVTLSMEEIDEMHVSKGGLTGVKTGYTIIDELTLGLNKGDLIIIAGRPSMGKTSLAMNIAENISTKENDPVGVGIFSLEMSSQQLVLRMLCGRARLNQQKVRAGKLKDEEWPRMARAGNVLQSAPIFVDDTPSMTVLEMRAKARRLKAQQDIGLIIVDYLQLMQGHGRAENRQQEISTISRSLKALAKELDIPVIAISQLSRQVEQRTGEKRPQLSDLRESGAIEQDADLVMFVYRSEFYLSHLEKTDPKFIEVEGKAEVIIAKQRNGPTGLANLTFIKDFARFENMEKVHRELPPGAEPVDGDSIPF
ncbi:MAG: replicative DNA helicase [candidate division Zixibacteria bacterium]|nr:replicative DNA helicase [candidate division Zixibacteria bacterium]